MAGKESASEEVASNEIASKEIASKEMAGKEIARFRVNANSSTWPPSDAEMVENAVLRSQRIL